MGEIFKIETEFPFENHLSFESLINFWKEKQKSSDKNTSEWATKVVEAAEAVPELQGYVKDIETVQKHKKTIELLLSAIFSKGTWEEDIKGVVAPFQTECFYETPRFFEIVNRILNDPRRITDEQIMETVYYKMLYAYMFVLEKFYNRKIEVDSSMILKTVDPETMLEKHYGALVNPKFADVKAKGKLPKLTDDDINDLLNHFQDMDYWMEKLPPSLFEFAGVTVLELVDITQQQMVSAIKEQLLTQDALLSPEKFSQIENNFKSLLGKQHLTLGIGAFQKTRNAIVNFGDKQHNIVMDLDQCGMSQEEDMKYFDQVYLEKKQLVIPDIDKSQASQGVIEQFKANGVQSLIIVPLIVDHEVVGIVEIGAPKPNDLNTLDLLHIKELLPVLAVAVKRGSDELENQIMGVIKDKFTALHQTVEWKFEEVALRYLDQRLKNKKTVIEPIVFDEVYPLYGSSDIRHSSEERNRSIQADLRKQLSMIRDVLNQVLKKYPFPIYRELDFEISTHFARLKKNLLSEDEVVITDMIHREIEPLFKHLIKIDKDLKPGIEKYFNSLDIEHGVLYRKRKDFEESVTRINQLVYSIIESEEEKTQDMFPYYFENYKTDGVEYNIYIGQSLVKNMQYNPIYLYNLRLWQLMVMCKVTRETHQLRESLPIPLETAQLILVHSSPLSIRFRTDEKKFDVDGAYNIRYEIMKKRIDKAVIKGTDERVTQPGMVSIIYSNQKEEEEYMDYIRYLAHLHYIDPEPEKLDLDYLQGVSGLKALRLKVNLSEDEAIEASFRKELMDVIGPYTTQ